MDEIELSLQAKEILGLAEALSRIQGNAKRILAERIFNQLETDQPGTARVAASLLCALGDDHGRLLGAAVLKKLSSLPAMDFARQEGRARERGAERILVRTPVDVLVLAIKEVELTACMRAFKIRKGTVPDKLFGGSEAYLVEWEGVRYAISWVGTDGNAESALKIAGLFTALEYRLAVLIGMSAGVKGEVDEGDVVVAESIWAVDFKVIKPGGATSPRPKTYSPSRRIFSGLTSMRNVDPEWAARVCDEVIYWSREDELCEVSPAVTEDWRPRFKFGAIFAGSRLIEDGSLPQSRETENARLLAAEMEGAGFAAACEEHRQETDWLVLRGVADFGEEDRIKGWQFASTYAAVALLRDGIALGRIEVRGR